jgi:hypothetical protein
MLGGRKVPEEEKKEEAVEEKAPDEGEEAAPDEKEEEMKDEGAKEEPGEDVAARATPALPTRKFPAAKLGFLQSTRGKIIVLILVIVVIVATGLAVMGPPEPEVTITFSFGDLNMTIPENYYAEETLSFSYGHRRAPIDTSATVTFPVEENATSGRVETEGDPGSVRRYDGGDRKEVDIEVVGANGKTMGMGATPQMNEIVELSAKDMERGGAGEWTVIVDCYSGTNVVVTVKIWVIYSPEMNGSTNDTGNETAAYGRLSSVPDGEETPENSLSLMEREKKATTFKL